MLTSKDKILKKKRGNEHVKGVREDALYKSMLPLPLPYSFPFSTIKKL